MYTKVRCILDAPLGFCSFQYTPILVSGNVFLFFLTGALGGNGRGQRQVPLSPSLRPPRRPPSPSRPSLLFPHLLSLVDVFTPGLFLAPFLVYTIAPLLFLCSFRWRGAHHQWITMGKIFFLTARFRCMCMFVGLRRGGRKSRRDTSTRPKRPKGVLSRRRPGRQPAAAGRRRSRQCTRRRLY